jgi:hypothetical protein
VPSPWARRSCRVHVRSSRRPTRHPARRGRGGRGRHHPGRGPSPGGGQARRVGEQRRGVLRRLAGQGSGRRGNGPDHRQPRARGGGMRRGIRVNAVALGTITTGRLEALLANGGPGAASTEEQVRALHPLGRAGRPTEAAGAVRYLLVRSGQLHQRCCPGRRRRRRARAGSRCWWAGRPRSARFPALPVSASRSSTPDPGRTPSPSCYRPRFRGRPLL